MALTLLESAKLAPDVQTRVVIEEYAASSDILTAIPFKDLDGGAYSYNREHTLPGIGFRGVNEAFSESTGVINPQVEALKIAGGDLDVDSFIINTQGEGVRASHEMMKVKALSQSWTRNFLKGDSRTDPRVFDGLQVRLTGSQLLSNANAGAALSLAALDALIDEVSSPTHLIMSKAMRRRLTQASRTQGVTGFVDWKPDELGRQAAYYQDLPILIAWKDNNDMEILDFTETSPDGTTSTVCTSIYCVSFGDMMVEGLQGRNSEGSYGISTRDLGELETKPVYRTRVDWNTAIAVQHGRAAARLAGITNAAVVA
jgi:hypothetical protein